MSIQQQTQEVVIQRLNALEQEIREIRKAVTQVYVPKFPEIKQEQQIEQTEQQEFNCTLYSVTKPINQRERKAKQKSSVCKQCANNRIKERHQKSKNDGTSQYRCVCGSTFHMRFPYH